MLDSLKIRDVIKRPYFRDSVVCASEKALDRIVDWVHILEVYEVGHLLNGDELILSTGLTWKNDEELCLSFLKQIIDKGASGLCIDMGRVVDHIPEEVKKYAYARDFPLILIYHDIRYIDVTRDLHTLIINNQLKRAMNSRKQGLYQENDWVREWMRGELEEDTIEFHLRLIDPSYNEYPKVAIVFSMKKISSRTFYLDELLMQRSLAIHTYLEKENLSVLPAQLGDQIILIVFDRGCRGQALNGIILYLIKRLKETDQHQTALFDGFIGIGRPFQGLNGLKKCIKEALETINIQKEIGAIAMPFYSQLHLHRIILDMKKSGRLTDFIQDTIGRLIQYDREKESRLLHTLETYLECEYSKMETAKRLYISRQSLYPRLEKIHELLGIEQMTYAKRVEMELALFAHQLMNRTSSE